MKQVVVVFQRNFQLGKVKTRLAKTVGDPLALEVYKKLVLITREAANKVKDADVHVFFDQEIEPSFLAKGNGHLQTGSNLGEKMAAAFSLMFVAGTKSVVLIGSDCPGLQQSHLNEAFNRLQKHDLVVGPADDGGYYLIGLNRPTASLFADIPWSSKDTLPATLAKAGTLGLSYSLLEKLGDLDNYSDYLTFKYLLD